MDFLGGGGMGFYDLSLPKFSLKDFLMDLLVDFLANFMLRAKSEVGNYRKSLGIQLFLDSASRHAKTLDFLRGNMFLT